MHPIEHAIRQYVNQLHALTTGRLSRDQLIRMTEVVEHLGDTLQQAHAWVRGRVDLTGDRRFPRSEILQQSGMRPRSFCPENRMPCDGKVDRFILPRGWLSKGL